MMEAEQKKRKVWKLVLTGGPCGGKTTGQAKLSTFFENLGWKVYRVPETATVLLGGGVNFADLPEYAQIEFQENLLHTMIKIENTFFALAEASERNCLVICDRGTMDASAFVTKQEWEDPDHINDLLKLWRCIVVIISIVSLGLNSFYIIHCHAKNKNVLHAHLLRHLNVRTVQGADGQPTVQHELHVAGAARLRASC